MNRVALALTLAGTVALGACTNYQDERTLRSAGTGAAIGAAAGAGLGAAVGGVGVGEGALVGAAVGGGIIWNWPGSDRLIVPTSGSLVVTNIAAATGSAIIDCYCVWIE